MESILDLLTERGKLADRLPGARSREIDEHRQLLGLIRAREAAAREAMLAHIIAWADTYDGAEGAQFEQAWKLWSV